MAGADTTKVKADWHQLSRGWHDRRGYMHETTKAIHAWMVEALAPKAGESVLEIGAGPGDTGFLAAPLLQPGGRLLSTDLAPGMVEIARRRAAELGIAGVAFQELDAQAMALGDATFDGALCRWGYMLMPDPLAALRETARVLKPGGRLVASVFTAAEDNPWATLPMRVLIACGFKAQPKPDAPSIVALGDRARLEGLLSDAGFPSWRIEALPLVWRFPDRDAYWDFLVHISALGPTLEALSDADAAIVKKQLAARTLFFEGTAGLELPAKCWMVRAER